MKSILITLIIVHLTWGAQIPVCPEGITLCASDYVDISDRAYLKGDIYSPRIVLGNDGLFVSDIFAKELSVRDRSQILGTLNSENNPNKGNQVYVGSFVNASFNVLPKLELAINPSQSPVMTLNDAESYLDPGVYGDLMIRARSTVFLSEGEYIFSKFQIEPDGILVLPECTESGVLIQVKGTVEFSDRANLINPDNCPLQVITESNVRIGNDQDLALNLRSAGNVEIGSRVSYQGKLSAKSIRVAPDVNFGLMSVVHKIPSDSLLESPPPIWSSEDFMQSVFRITEPNQELREHWESIIQNAAYTGGRGHGTWRVPIMTIGVPFRIQDGQQIKEHFIAVTGTTETLIYTPTIQFSGIALGQIFMGDEILGWEIIWDSQVYKLGVGGIIQVPAGDDGEKSVGFKVHLASGRQFENKFLLTVQKEDATYYEGEL
jgi:hypothetical protein